MNKDFLDKTTLQGMMPDYIFDRLEAKQKEIFEVSVAAYPELLSEILEAKEVFAKADLMEYNSIIETASDSISVKVNQKLSNSRRRSMFPSFKPRFAKFAMPIAAVFAFGYWGTVTDFWGMGSDTRTELISDSDFKSLFEGGSQNNTESFLAFDSPTQLDGEVISTTDLSIEELEIVIDEWTFDSDEIQLDDIDLDLEYDIQNYINTEEEFQSIYGES